MRQSKLLVLAGIFFAGCHNSRDITTSQPSASLSTLAVDRATGVIADGADHATITVTVRDDSGAAMSGQTVQLSAAGLAAMLSQPALTDANGQTTATLSSTALGTATISAVVSTVSLAQTPTVQFVAGPATRLAFQVQPGAAAAGAVLAPPVQVVAQDAEGHTAPSSSAAVTIALSGGSAGAVLQGTATEAPLQGVASFQDLIVTTAGSGYTLAATAPGLSPATSAPFDVTAGAEARLVFTAQPSSAIAGSPFANAVQVSIEDGDGNVVTSATDAITLALASGPASASLAGTLTAQAVSGVATFSGLSVALAGSGYTLSASAAGLSPATSAAFGVAAAGASQLAFLVQPSSAQAGATLAPAMKIAIEDAFGNTVLTSSATISVALDADAGATLAGTTAQAAIDGIATFPDLSIALPGTYTLAATSDALSGTSASFTITSGPPASLAFATAPSTIAAGAPFAPPIQVALQDALGNRIAGTTAVTLSIGARGNPAAALGGTATQSAIGGIATFPGLTIPQAGAGYTLVATASEYAGAESAPFDVTAAAPASADTVVRASPASLVADGASATTITVAVADALGNPVPQQAVSLSVSGSANTLGAAAGTTDGSGIFTTTLASTKAEQKTITATAGVAAATAQVSFEAGPPAAQATTLTASPATVAADGSSSATLTLAVADLTATRCRRRR